MGSLASALAQELTSTLGLSVNVDNIGGAVGSRGTETVARANPDGYTLLWANVAPIPINMHLYKNLYKNLSCDLLLYCKPQQQDRLADLSLLFEDAIAPTTQTFRGLNLGST